MLTCNDPSLLGALGFVHHFRLQRPSADAMLEQLVLVASHQGISTTLQRLADIVKICSCDIRCHNL